jgi:ribosomal protein S18 acetylase RimI-like enzyme
MCWKKMVEYAKALAAENGCAVIRLDTFAHNEPARNLYLRNGFRIAGYGRILLQGLIDEEQVYLECEVRYE